MMYVSTLESELDRQDPNQTLCFHQVSYLLALIRLFSAFSGRDDFRATRHGLQQIRSLFLLRKPLDPGKHPDFLVPDEVEDHHGPARMAGKSVVKLRGEGTESGKARPCDRWEVVVFVVIANLGGSEFLRDEEHGVDVTLYARTLSGP